MLGLDAPPHSLHWPLLLPLPPVCSMSACCRLAICTRSFPALSCEFATLDVSDALGTKRMNLTKTLRKTPIDLNLDHHGAAYEDNHKVQPKYDDEDMWVSKQRPKGGACGSVSRSACVFWQQGT